MHTGEIHVFSVQCTCIAVHSPHCCDVATLDLDSLARAHISQHIHAVHYPRPPFYYDVYYQAFGSTQEKSTSHAAGYPSSSFHLFFTSVELVPVIILAFAHLAVQNARVPDQAGASSVSIVEDLGSLEARLLHATV